MDMSSFRSRPARSVEGDWLSSVQEVIFHHNHMATLSAPYPLHKAASRGNVEELTKLLTTEGSDVNQCTHDMVRPLHEACQRGHYDCVVLLHQFGAGLNFRNIDGATPLSDACAHGSMKVIKFLLDNGADINPPFLLTTPLHEAVLGNKWDCIPFLVGKGADMEASDLDYGTPLHMAAIKGHVECARALLEAGAKVNVVKAHQTPLHHAAAQSHTQLAEMLLQFGADVYVTDRRNRTPKDLAPPGTPDLCVLLESWEKTPQSLTQLCRLTVRRSLGPARLARLDALQIPSKLKRYLAHA